MKDLSRLFYLACELRPALPDRLLLARLGKGWATIIKAGAELGLGGSTAAIPNVSIEQLSNFYMTGAESGALPHLEEFRALLTGQLYDAIEKAADLSNIEKMQLFVRLGRWYNGLESTNGDGEMSWDAVIETPPFTKTGFWPLDKIAGPRGLPQEVVTLLARPEVGKTTLCLATAFAWRRNDIGPVTFIQTEIAASALRMKIDGMGNPSQLFRKDMDKLVFGRRAAEDALQKCIDEPDPDRLVIFDSIGGYAGQGDTPESRTRYADLFDLLTQVKNHSRAVIAAGHVKRGTTLSDLEMAAGSSAIERFSGVLLYMNKDTTPSPDGTVDVTLESLKNRYDMNQRKVKFSFNYRTGEAQNVDEELE